MLKIGKHGKIREEATSGKVVQTSGVLYFSANEKYEQSAVPEEIRQAGEREFPIRQETIARKVWGKDGSTNASKVRSSRFPLDVAEVLTILPLPFLSHLAFCHELSVPKSSATCTRTRKTRVASRTRRARFVPV